MSMSRPRSAPRAGRDPNARSVDPGPPRRREEQFGAATVRGCPEWKTERWRLQVEAEARSRLKKRIREIASER